MGTLPLHTGGGVFTVVLGEEGTESFVGEARPVDEGLTVKEEDGITEKLLGFVESGIVETMAGLGEPDEIVRSVIELVTVEMVALLSFAGNAPSCGADEPMDLTFFAGNSNMDMFTAAFVESIIRTELVGQFVAGCRFDVSPFVGIIGSTVNHGRWNAPFS